MTAPWFADTFYFLAILNPRDAYHGLAHELTSSARRRVVTTQFVLLEVADALSSTQNRGLFVELLERLRKAESVTLVEASGSLFEDGFRLYSERSDKDWSLTDCISFVTMDRIGLKDALTGDRHFQQAGFTALFTP